MNIYRSAQIKEWEARTLIEQGITGLTLMERAASLCYDWLTNRAFTELPLHIICGKGNNGGDGLALARMLIRAGTDTKVYILENGKPGTQEFQHNLTLLHSFTTDITFIQDGNFVFNLEKDAVVIDALYGIGLNRPLDEPASQIVASLNSLPITVISIDVPSGLLADGGNKGNIILSATHTLTFQNLKAAFLFRENQQHLGQVHLLDLGLSKSFPESQSAAWEMIDNRIISGIIRKRSPFSHKGDFGHALLICGSFGMMGAAILAAKGCLVSGAGKLTCIVPECGYGIMQTAVPEAMCRTSGRKALELIQPDFEHSAVGIGPGLSQGRDVQLALINFLRASKIPVVLDADALNCLATLDNGHELIPAGSVITPHPKEFERLFGETTDSFDQLELAISIAATRNIYIVLKGHYTATITPKGKVYFNNTGNAGMAKGGTGDVLTGILTGLIAQGYPLPEAALLAVQLHGIAGDLAADARSEEAMQPTDLINFMGAAWKLLHTRAI